jgi:hypothetical protein
MLTGRKLLLTLAFAALIALAAGISCSSFFPPNTLSSITIQPPSPQVEVGQSTTLQAWGTYSDNSRAQITSGLAWSSSDPTVIQIDPTSGKTTGEGSGGTATITASAEGLSATATATAYLPNLSSFKVCQGTYSTGTCSNPTWSLSSSGQEQQTYYTIATYTDTEGQTQTVDVTAGSTFTLTTTAPSAGGISCTSGSSPVTCTVDALTTMGTYTITVTYTGWTGTAPTITISITST